MLTAETEEKHLLFLYFDLFYSCLWIFYFSFLPPPFPSMLLQLLILLVLLNLFKFLRIFFFPVILSVSFIHFYLYVGPFAVLWSFPFSFLLFKNILNLAF